MRIDSRKWGVALIASTILVLLGAGYAVLTNALPRRDGDVRIPGLMAAVEIELDAHAIPRIRAASLEDALRGQGFVHAQERFFQMDLLRRSAAGELAALVGEQALPLDRAQRAFQFRERSRALLQTLPPRQVAWLQAYAEGVNAGLADLGARPPEYWLLRSRPAEWMTEDTLLVVFSFYTTLSNNEAYERGQAVMHAVLPASVYEFLTPSTSRFDRPLVALEADPTGGYTPLSIPPAEVIDLRARPLPSPASGSPDSGLGTRIDPPLLGPASNQWAAGASRGSAGAAILANDPHLSLRVPNVFYRCELFWQDRVVRGVSIPGVPGILIGASDTLAWGVTASIADQSDWVIVDVDAQNADRYRTPEGTESFQTTRAEIAVRGRAVAEPLDLRSTRWGPVVARDWLGRPLALHAAWLAPGGLNLDVLDLMLARDVGEGVQVLRRWAGPSLSWMLADTAGEIAWAVNGPLPRRVGFDGSKPESWADGARRWQGEIARPTLWGRSDGVLFSANNRTLPPEQAQAVSRMWMRPLRAERIDELLKSQLQFTERDFLAMQLDTRARGYDQIRDVLLEVVAETETQPELRRARAYVLDWNGRADVSEVGFRILHLYYRALLERLLALLLMPAIDADPTFVYRWPLADEPLRRLLEERPAHLLTREFADWPALLRQILLDALQELKDDPSRPGLDASWSEVNTLDVGHPFAALPLLGRRLRLPPVPLPGSTLSLRVSAPNYGALIRMSVAPSRPTDGILQMSGGQSGHFLSKNFRDLQSDWVDGTPTPFLAGPTTSSFKLTPAQR
ncbi:MAG TPA: penicillin acylase family protein [Gammaproteobacteria bacterium]|nr:penicillin acylase family protein [Gammaproteobacteria bacterium]